MKYEILKKIIDRKHALVVPTIFLRQTLTEEQYQDIEPLWGYVLDPYRENESHYVLSFMENEDPTPLLQYLDMHKIKYSLELILTDHEDLL